MKRKEKLVLNVNKVLILLIIFVFKSLQFKIVNFISLVKSIPIKILNALNVNLIITLKTINVNFVIKLLVIVYSIFQIKKNVNNAHKVLY